MQELKDTVIAIVVGLIILLAIIGAVEVVRLVLVLAGG